MALILADVVERIELSFEAKAIVSQWCHDVQRALKLLRQPLPEDFQRAAVHIIAMSICAASARAADLHNPSDRQRTGQEERLPSQIRIQLIKELEDHAAFFAKPRGRRYIRARKTMSRYAVSLILGQVSFARAVASPFEASPPGGDGAGPAFPSSTGDQTGVSHGAHDLQHLSMLTGDPDIDAASLFRRQVWSERNGDVPVAMRIDPLQQRLDAAIAAKIVEASDSLDHRGHVDLRTLQSLLKEDDDRKLADTCRHHARMLELTFGIAERRGKDVQSTDTLSSFVHEPTLGRLVVTIFELLAPTHYGDDQGVLAERPLDDVLIHLRMRQGSIGKAAENDCLPEIVKRATLSGLVTVQEVCQLLYGTDVVDLNVDAGLMKMTEDVAKGLRSSKNSLAMDIDSREDVDHRIVEGQRRSVDRVWKLRQSWLLLRGYAIFLGWYKRTLMQEIFDQHLQLYLAFERVVFRPIEQQSVEMGIRFGAGQVPSVNEGARRITGQPLPMWKIPAALIARPPTLVDYPGDGIGFYPDPIVVSTLMKVLSKHRPEAPQVWSEALALVDPRSLIQRPSGNEKSRIGRAKDPTQPGV